jgi:hypothetical protein
MTIPTNSKLSPLSIHSTLAKPSGDKVREDLEVISLPHYRPRKYTETWKSPEGIA